ncbi:UNVERIFIED_CONTAM: hypothetical protein FKN15_014391 [Acipenser sinensis]
MNTRCPPKRYSMGGQRSSGQLTGKPAVLALGRTLRGPLDRLIAVAPAPSTDPYQLLDRQQQIAEEVRDHVAKAQKRQARNYNARRAHCQYEEGRDLDWPSDACQRLQGGGGSPVTSACQSWR